MVVTHSDEEDRVYGVGGTWQPLLLVVGQETQLVAAARGGGSAACCCWLWGGALQPVAAGCGEADCSWACVLPVVCEGEGTLGREGEERWQPGFAR